MSKKKSSKKWSEKTDKKLIELVNQGVTYRVIAMKLKRSKAAVGARVYYLRQQGVVFNNKQRGRPVTAHKTEPAAVKVAKKVLSKEPKKDTSWMEKDFNKPLLRRTSWMLSLTTSWLQRNSLSMLKCWRSRLLPSRSDLLKLRRL